MAASAASNCCNVFYDIFTILLSIADVATDIIVLVDFYIKGRMTFFAISLTILILAQCAYSMAFGGRFNTLENWGPFACCAFCCLSINGPRRRDKVHLLSARAMPEQIDNKWLFRSEGHLL